MQRKPRREIAFSQFDVLSISSDQVMKQYGGIFNIEDAGPIDKANIAVLQTRFKDLVADLLSNELLDDASDLELIILNNHDAIFFACIRPMSNEATIYISIASIRCVWNILLLVFADPAIIPKYPGDQIINYSFRDSISAQVLFAEPVSPIVCNDSMTFTAHSETHQPITEERLELCDLLFQGILDHVLYHEAMHFTRDHQNFNKIFKEEFKGGLEELVRLRTRYSQMIELDADMTALHQALHSQPEFQDPEHSQWRDFVFVENLMYIILQQILDLKSVQMPLQLLLNHPPPVFRAILFSNYLKDLLTNLKNIDQEIIQDEQSYAWIEGSKIARKLNLPEGRWRGSNMDDISFPLLDEWSRNFNDLNDIFTRNFHSGDYSEFIKFWQTFST